jgi:hypothetical protein
MTSQIPEPPVPDPTPAPDPLARLAADLGALLDRFEASIPNYEPHDVNDIHAVVAAARFGQELIAPTVTAATAFPPLTAHNLFDTARAEEALRFRDLLRPIAQRMEALRAGLDFTIDRKLAKASTDALETYQWAKRRAKRKDSVALRPYVDNMRLVMRKSMNHRPKGPAVPPTGQSLLAPAVASQGKFGDLPPLFQQVIREEQEEGGNT